MVWALACAPAERTPPAPIRATPPPVPAPERTETHDAVAPAGDVAESDPTPSFQSFAELKAGAETAVGKLGRLRLRRDHFTSSSEFTAVSCEGDGFLRLEYTPDQRDYVRAMYGSAGSSCASVLFSVTSVDPRGPFFDAKVERISGIEPKKPTPAADGSDYGTIDDVLLAGAEAKGKVVSASVWVYDGDPQLLRVHDCGRVDVDVFVIPHDKKQKALVKLLSNNPAQCVRARFRIVEPTYVTSASDGSVTRPRADVVSVP